MKGDDTAGSPAGALEANRGRTEVIRPADRAEWRAWLEASNAWTTGVFVTYCKARSRIAGPRYEDIVEEALCFGWIDGTLRPVDDDVTSVWCSPRRPRSVWAASNRARVQRLSDAGRMAAPGLAAVQRARLDGSWEALALSRPSRCPRTSPRPSTDSPDPVTATRSPSGASEGDWFRVGFSPRKAKLSLYGLQGHPRSEKLLARLGPHTLGAGCVYATRLDRLDLDVLRELVAHSVADVTSVEVTAG